MAFNMNEWLETINKDKVIFRHIGIVTDNSVTDSLSDVDNLLEGTASRIRKKIYNVFVECMQNLYHHSLILPDNKEYEQQGKYVVCLISRNNVGYNIITGNFVDEKQKNFLTKHLNHINSLNKDELKEMYKNILNNQEFSEKGGGGLGMIDISRKSGSKLDYKFYDYKNGFYFFSLNIQIVEQLK